jgi:iron complex outermembrane receptor protein
MYQENKNKGTEVLIPEYDLFDIGSFIYTQRTWGKTTMSGGVRYDYRALDSKELLEGSQIKYNGFNKYFSNFSASAGASYSATDNFVVKLNAATGFRAPSIPELASNGAHEGTNRYEYGEQRLKSERSFQLDLGTEFNSEHLMLTGNLFYNSIGNFVFYNKLTGVSGTDSLVDVNGDLIPAFKFNQRNVFLAGAEFVSDLHPHPLDWLHWQNTLSFVRGLFREPVEGVRDLPMIPAMRWLSEIRGEFLKKGKLISNLIVFVELDHTAEQDKAFTAFQTETTTPAYTLLHAGFSGNFMVKKRTLFSLYFNARNITDKSYQSHLSRLKYTSMNPVTGRQGVFNMGRNFSIKLNIPVSF